MSNILCIGSGLISGHTNQTNEFTVYTERGGIHGLSVGIDGPSRAEIRTSDNRDGTVKVQYTPKVPGDYKITIRYDGISVKGSPYSIRVRGGESVLTQPTKPLSMSGTSDFDQKFAQAEADFDRRARELGASIGGGIGGVSRVRVSGRGLYSGICNINNEICVDVRDAGAGRLHWSIEGPGHVESKNRGLSDGMYRLYYRTDTPGEYRVTIRWDDLQVNGSPFMIRVL
jgi:hypothetical protein